MGCANIYGDEIALLDTVLVATGPKQALPERSYQICKPMIKLVKTPLGWMQTKVRLVLALLNARAKPHKKTGCSKNSPGQLFVQGRTNPRYPKQYVHQSCQPAFCQKWR